MTTQQGFLLVDTKPQSHKKNSCGRDVLHFLLQILRDCLLQPAYRKGKSNGTVPLGTKYW